jgi:protein SCO1
MKQLIKTVLNVSRAQWLQVMSCCMVIALMFAVIKPVVVNAEIEASSFYKNFEDLTFVDQDSHAFPIIKLKGKVTLFNFIYTHCSRVCLVQTKELAEIYKSLEPAQKQNIRFVSVSLDSANDKPAALKSFARNMGRDVDGWAFITGDYDDVKKLASRLSLFGNAKPKEPAKEFKLENHSTMMWLIDAQGKLMQRYGGAPMDKQRLKRELIQLESMRSNG